MSIQPHATTSNSDIYSLNNLKPDIAHSDAFKHRYFNIHFLDNTITLLGSSSKPNGESALSVLTKIESLLRMHLNYSQNSPPHCLNQLSEELLKKARLIAGGYEEKMAQLVFLRKFVCRNNSRTAWKMVENMENLLNPPRFLPLPLDCIKEIFNNLTLQEWGSISRLNKHSNKIINTFFLQLAQQHGYENVGNTLPSQYLSDLKKQIELLSTNTVFAQICIFQERNQKSTLHFRATLNALKCLKTKQIFQLFLDERLYFSGMSFLRNAIIKHQLKESSKEAYDETLQILSRDTLDYAIRREQTDAIEMLLKLGTDVNFQDPDIFPFLIRFTCKEKITSLLLAYEANINQQASSCGSTALHLSVTRNHSENLKFLLEHSADPNIQNNEGQTPLYLAVKNGRKEMIEMLLSKQADPNISTNSGFSPLCSNTSNPDILNILLDHGANINHQTLTKRFSALHFAIHHKQIPSVKFLLSKGADVHLQDNKGMTPLKLARKKGLTDIIAILVKHGNRH